MKMSLRISTRKGKIVRVFTILELLIVISVIAILASLLLPALNSAREKAQAITCTGNLKQIGAAFVIYSGEYFPVAARDQWGNPGSFAWLFEQDFYSLIKGGKGKNYFCPTSIGKLSALFVNGNAHYNTYGAKIGPWHVAYENKYATTNRPYLTVGDLDDSGERMCARSLLLVGKLRNPSDYFFVTDSMRSDSNHLSFWKIDRNDSRFGFGAVHARRANTLCADGHVAALSASEITRLSEKSPFVYDMSGTVIQ